MRHCLTLSLSSALIASAADPSVSFNRDIRPIMSDTCFHCHGFDSKTREAGLRLDLRAEAIRPTDNGVTPIVPGDPDQSEIIRRIFDDDDPMPPDKAHKPLTAAQKDLFRRWVVEGAVYEPHWAYTPLTRPTLPEGRETQHPIDAFVQAKLSAQGLKPSPQAPLHILQRRLSLDLIGLPPLGPSTTDLQSEVDQLLASPHFGERMAVWWLDIARYADTVGFHGDQNQRIFPYRDYVIDAFNANKPFDQFTREQLAGDLLPNPTPEQLTATGYNRLNMMTREGGAQPKEYLAKYGAERVRSVAAAWFGSTFGCAECHDHKFDPILSRDFYELQAFFADVKQWGVYSDYSYSPNPELKGFNNQHPFPPELEVESRWLKKRLNQTLAEIDVLLQKVVGDASKDPTLVFTWEQSLQSFLADFPSGWMPVSDGQITKQGKPIEGRVLLANDQFHFRPDKRLNPGEALEFRVPLKDLPSLAAIQIEVPRDQKDLSWKGQTLQPTFSILSSSGKRTALPVGADDADVRRWDYRRTNTEVLGLDFGWKLPFDSPKSDGRAVWLLKKPIVPAPGDTFVITIAGDPEIWMRLSISPLGALMPLQVASKDFLQALSTPNQDRTAEHQKILASTHLFSTAHQADLYDKARSLALQARELTGGRTKTLVTVAMKEPLPIRVLPRGNWQDESGPLVQPATPSFLPVRIESSEQRRLNRLDLANWIVSDANPITARAVMNRLWYLFFGAGLSSVIDDLGSQGEPPSHPELLDWLACEFRESGWDIKHMVKLIVTSQTYQQITPISSQSHLTDAADLAGVLKNQEEARTVDPANRLLAYQNPRRLDAEFVRDNALAIAGLLRLEDIGGPSVKPYQPEGYYAALQFPNRDYEIDTDERQWRRGLYTHWQRTFLHPMLANFDAPARDECAAARTQSNTPQQALTLLNDPTFVEAARALAARVLLEDSVSNDANRLQFAFRLTLHRSPNPSETDSLTRFLSTQRSVYETNPDDAKKLVEIGLSPTPSINTVEHAAWTQLARVLLNTQETITRY